MYAVCSHAFALSLGMWVLWCVVEKPLTYIHQTQTRERPRGREGGRKEQEGDTGEKTPRDPLSLSLSSCTLTDTQRQTDRYSHGRQHGTQLSRAMCGRVPSLIRCLQMRVTLPTPPPPFPTPHPFPRSHHGTEPHADSTQIARSLAHTLTHAQPYRRKWLQDGTTCLLTRSARE